MAAFKSSRGYAAKPRATGAFGVPWSEQGKGTGTFSRGPAAASPAQATAAGPPIDPFYDAAVGAANRNLSQGLAGIQAQRGQLGQTYGYGIDRSGNVFDDVTNPYSRAATLQKMHDEAVRGTTTGMAARGQLYAGSLQNAQNANVDRNLRGRDALIREFMAAQSGLNQAELTAGNAHADALAAAGSDRLGRALASRPDAASVAPVAAPAAVAPVPVKKRKPAKGRRP